MKKSRTSKPHEIIVDSGAFSFRRSKEKVRSEIKEKEDYLESYIGFCLENKNWIDYFVNLDVIPLDPWKSIKKEQAQLSAKEGWDNYWYIVSRGVPKEQLIHVFHRDEPWSYLEAMVENMPYIGLSPGRYRNIAQKIRWLDTCMNIICDGKGYPKTKFHGFAVTSLRLMSRYPWYSVDSSSWTSIARQGAVVSPAKRKNKWEYVKQQYCIGVSSRTSYPRVQEQPKNIKNQFYDYLNLMGYKLGTSKFRKVDENYKINRENEIWFKKGEIVEEVVERGISNDHRLRNEMNALFYINLEKELPKWPWPFKEKKKRGFLK